MTRSAAALFAVAVLCLTACGGPAAQGGDVAVRDARVPVPAGANGAAYLTLINDGDGDVRLVGADTPVAEAVQIHETSIEDGMASMAQVDGVDVPARGSVVFEPGGLHLMLLGVDGDLAEGDTVELELTFDGVDPQTVTADVVAMGDAPMEMGSHGTGSSDAMGMSSHS